MSIDESSRRYGGIRSAGAVSAPPVLTTSGVATTKHRLDHQSVIGKAGTGLPVVAGQQLPKRSATSTQPDSRAASTSSQPCHATGKAEHKFRPDIEGLRAVAVLAVVLYHAGLAQLKGGFIGVDVFFVISGFLITSQLITEVKRTGTVSLANFWARRARRLLPAVATMLAATSLAVIVLWPALRRATTLLDIGIAAVYGANWRFIATNVEYGATSGRSPVLHLWSLGVEEQFYLVWPLLVVATVWWARRKGWSTTKALAGSVSLIWLGSFVWSWMASRQAPMFAYFSLPTRAWQLATGALLALAAVRLARLASPVRIAMGWAGLAAIAVAVLVLVEGEHLPYPGWAALLPTLAAAAVLASGLGSVPRFGPVLLLRNPVMQFMGKLSYGWYLWHWPFVVLAPAALNRPVSLLENVALSFAALGMAWVSFHLIENPVRHSRALLARPMTSLALGAALTVLPAVLAYSLIGKAAPGAVSHNLAIQAAPEGKVSGNFTGAVRSQKVQLSPLQASKDKGLVATPCQVGRTATAPAPDCTFGAVGSGQRLVLLGDSHASHWFPAVEQLAQQQNLQLTAWTKSWCQLTDVPLLLNGQPYQACQQWKAEVLQRLRADPPATILISGLDILGHPKALPQIRIADARTGASLDPDAAKQAWQAGYLRMLQQLRSTGAQVVVIADTPLMTHLVPDCLASTGSVSQCSTAREKAWPSGEDARLARQAGVPVWDFNDQLCDASTCWAVKGEHIAWWDKQHLTASFAATLAPKMVQFYLASF